MLQLQSLLFFPPLLYFKWAKAPCALSQLSGVDPLSCSDDAGGRQEKLWSVFCSSSTLLWCRTPRLPSLPLLSGCFPWAEAAAEPGAEPCGCWSLVLLPVLARDVLGWHTGATQGWSPSHGGPVGAMSGEHHASPGSEPMPRVAQGTEGSLCSLP